jgi:outer membrane protein assembly factor BamA
VYSQEQTGDTSFIIIDKILIEGNKKTKDRIILRELNFKEGDTINRKNQKEIFEWNKNRIFNTNLFITVNLYVVDINSIRKTILITVQERWYIYPIPVFELADRNFNEWWQDRNRDPERINAGIFYVQKNVRGRNETLRFKLQAGFTKKIELFYLIPYLNKNQKAGLNYEISYIRNKQVAFMTSENKLLYFDGDKVMIEKFRTAFTYTYRDKFYETHALSTGFFYNHIADTISLLNPDFFLKGRNSQRYFSIKYSFIHDKRDMAYYPLKGKFLRVEIEKSGLGIFNDINQINLKGEFAWFRTLHKKIFFAALAKQKVSFPEKQPYLQSISLGYDKDYVSGYELYVIEGPHFSLARLNLKWQLFSIQKEVESVPVNEFQTIPFAIYLKIYSDAGYVWNPYVMSANARFSNEFLCGAGIGLDVVSYYDFVMRLEYSVNRTGGHGFFLHFRSGI